MAAPVRVLLKGRCYRSLLRTNPGTKKWRCSAASLAVARLVMAKKGWSHPSPFLGTLAWARERRGVGLGNRVPRQAPRRLQGDEASAAPTAL